MNDQFIRVCLSGGALEAALDEFQRPMGAWGIAPPEDETFVLDFGLGRFRQVGLIECWIANEIDAGYCGKWMFNFEGQSCPEHRHRRKTESFHVVKGRVAIRSGGREHVLNPGQSLLVSPMTFHDFTALDGPSLLLELSTPCHLRDNEFTDPDIMEAFKVFGEYPPRFAV